VDRRRRRRWSLVLGLVEVAERKRRMDGKEVCLVSVAGVAVVILKVVVVVGPG
jgi:hypothetical protein